MKIGLFFILLYWGFSASAQTANQSMCADSLVAQMTLDEKLNYFSGNWQPHDRGTHDLHSGKIERLGIPAFRMEYATQGVHCNGKSTLYPAPLALAATFDTTLVRRVAQSIGRDCRARGIQAALAPELALYQPSVCELQSETFGDNCNHTFANISAFAQGLMEQQIAPIGRYCVTDAVPSPAQELLLRRVANQGLLAGIQLRNPSSKARLTETDSDFSFLRQACHFQGILLSDIWQTHATLAAFQKNIDLDLPKGEWLNAEMLKPLVVSGQVQESEINRRVVTILSTVFRFGLDKSTPADFSIAENVPEARAIALEAARKALTLVKNERKILPLKTHAERLLVIGNRVYKNTESDGLTSVYPFSSRSLGDCLDSKKNVDVLPRAREYIDLTVTDEFFTDDKAEIQGLKAAYYNSGSLEGTPSAISAEKFIDYAWGEQLPAKIDSTHFAVRWSGTYIPKTDKIVRLGLSGSDYASLSVDGKIVGCNKGFASTVRESEALFRAEAGKKYRIEVDFVACSKNPDIQLTYSPIAADNLDERMRKASKIIVSVGSPAAIDAETMFWIDLVEKYKQKVIVVIQSCDMNNMDWCDKAAAVLLAWNTGESAGEAIFDVLFGTTKPSGRMPIETERYPFGYGLNY